MIFADFTTRIFKLIIKKASEAFSIPLYEFPRVIFHGVILAIIISGFWLLDSLKDPIFASIVGIEFQPWAKIGSIFSTLIVVCIYDFLTSMVNKPTLFLIVSIFFGMIIMILSALLTDPIYGLPNKDKNFNRSIGWIVYFTIEAYGSLMVALFWSYTNSIMDLEQAKGAYGLIISIAQIGAIIGSTLATNSTDIGIPQLFLFGAMSIFSVSLIIKIYHIVYKESSNIESASNRVRSISEASYSSLLSYEGDKQIEKINEITFLQSIINVFKNFYEGLSLILSYRYTIFLLGVSCLYEIVVTVLDYEFKLMGADSISSTPSIAGFEEESDRFAKLLGHFGQFTNILSFIVSFFGFSFLVHRLGVQHTLIVFPFVLFFAVVISNLIPNLWVLFIVVSVLKALIFSLNEPVKELLYIPTSDAIKFKAKAWIDVFGARLAKGVGSLITNLSNGDVKTLRVISEIPCIILCIGIIILSWMLGIDFNRLVKKNIVIGDEIFTGIQYDTSSINNNIVRNGLKHGDVGYDGYDLDLFLGVFDDEILDETSVIENKDNNFT
jgi:AAA family ATP:ADP antiporter